jgi:hypothetical protein
VRKTERRKRGRERGRKREIGEAEQEQADGSEEREEKEYRGSVSTSKMTVTYGLLSLSLFSLGSMSPQRNVVCRTNRQESPIQKRLYWDQPSAIYHGLINYISLHQPTHCSGLFLEMNA